MSYPFIAEQHLFPHDHFRPIQAKFVSAVGATVAAGKQIMVHAPTGIGKTASTLGPAVAYAITHKKTVFFLTSRHTQHLIALETLQQLQNKHKRQFGVVNLVGKQHLCLQPGVMNLSSSEFNSYCKDQREKRMCSFYTNARKTSGTLDVQGKAAFEQLHNNIIPLELLKDRCGDFEVCPYEIALELSKEARVIVADYYYIFHDTIRNSFFRRADLFLSDCVVIVDEAHNLPSRIKELASVALTSRILSLAVREADKAKEDGALQIVTELRTVFDRALDEQFTEKLVDKEYFLQMIEQVGKLEDIVSLLEAAGDRVRDEKRNSFLLSIAEFITRWQGPDYGFSRILSKKLSGNNTGIQLSYSCLDAGVVSRPILKELHSTVFMSGTLRPLQMYRDVLGVDEDATLLEFDNPFPKEHVLSLVVPSVSTRYSARDDAQFDRICLVVAQIIEAIPGNTIVFFPSYELLTVLSNRLSMRCSRTIFVEEKGMSSTEKKMLLESFASYAKTGAVLFAVSSGSFGEGIDLPGDLLKGVVVVGVPLARPDLEIKEVIGYYQQKFGRGWDYGYIIPAFNTVVQNAGRCIRSTTDRGVVVYVDDRFAGQLKNYFPKETQLVIDGQGYVERIRDFFGRNV